MYHFYTIQVCDSLHSCTNAQANQKLHTYTKTKHRRIDTQQSIVVTERTEHCSYSTNQKCAIVDE